MGRTRKKGRPRSRSHNLERETGFEPATPTLARLCSTTELFPPNRLAKDSQEPRGCQAGRIRTLQGQVATVDRRLNGRHHRVLLLEEGLKPGVLLHLVE